MKKLIALKAKKLKQLSPASTSFVKGGTGGGGSTVVPTQRAVAEEPHIDKAYVG